jgi:hypothetical protein
MRLQVVNKLANPRNAQLMDPLNQILDLLGKANGYFKTMMLQRTGVEILTHCYHILGLVKRWTNQSFAEKSLAAMCISVVHIHIRMGVDKEAREPTCLHEGIDFKQLRDRAVATALSNVTSLKALIQAVAGPRDNMTCASALYTLFGLLPPGSSHWGVLEALLREALTSSAVEHILKTACTPSPRMVGSGRPVSWSRHAAKHPQCVGATAIAMELFQVSNGAVSGV